MKKIICIAISVLTICLCMFGCGKNNIEENTTTVKENLTANQQTTISDSIQNTYEDIGGGNILQDKYRICYYDIPRQFASLVDEEELDKWEDELYSIPINDRNQMVMMLYVRDFNIEREDFDKANENWANWISQKMNEVPVMNPQDYTNQEMWEVYNADIIYTFDDEIINAYYLSHSYPFLYESEYENAVLAGEYRTQTTDFYFPELDSHSCVSLRGFEYPEETTIASVETTTEKEETTMILSEVITE